MVLKYGRLLAPQRCGDFLTLLFCHNDAIEVLTKGYFFVERTRVLVQDIDVSADRAPGTSIERMAVGCTDYVWPSVVNCTVNHESSSVQQTSLSTGAAFEDVAFTIYQDQIASVDESEAARCQWQF